MTTVRISDIAAVIRGVSYDKTEVSDMPKDGYLPILRAGNICDTLDIDNDLVWVSPSNVSATQIIRSGDIAICMSSGSASVVGKTATAKNDWSGSVGAFCGLIRTDANRCLPEYLGFYLKSHNFRRWTSEAQGANIKNIRKSALEDFAIPLPPLPEQRRIVDILSRAEGIVRLRREAQKKAAEIIPALFIDMFGDPATNPKPWKESTLGDVIEEFRYGTSQKSGSIGYPTLRIPNVIGDRLDPSEIKFVATPDKEAQRLRLLDGDLLFVRTNGNPDYVGRSAVFNSKTMRDAGFDSENCLYASYLIRGRIMRKIISPHYLQVFLSSMEGRRRLKERCRTSAGQYNINIDGLSSIVIPLPPLERQLAFEHHCPDIFSIQSQKSAATQKAEATFNALLSRAFQGELA